MKIPDNTKIQSADLRVRNLKNSLNFYSNLLGLGEIERGEDYSLLSANGKNPYLIRLVEDKNAKPRSPNTTGLFHIAFRFPNRKELARVFMRLFNNKIKFQGFSDHLVSEAIYLPDPEGNGIELYADKSRETWNWKLGQVLMDSLPLDLSVITKELGDPQIWNGIHPEVYIGHIHLKVSNLFKAEKFYNDILGFNVTNTLFPGALFLSAGGYHHHIGANVWSSNNGNPPDKNSLGLINYTIKIPDQSFLNLIEAKANVSKVSVVTEEGTLCIQDFDNTKIKLTL